MTVSCGAPAISSGTMYPPKHTVDLGIDGERQMTFEQGNEVQMEVLGMAPTCANKIPHLEPCVPHDPDTPTYLRCKWTGAAGEVEVPVNAYADWITTNGIKSDLVARVNCSIPPYNSIVAATGYDGTLAFADGAPLTVSLTFVRNESIQWDVPYAGGATPPPPAFLLAPSPPRLAQKYTPTSDICTSPLTHSRSPATASHPASLVTIHKLSIQPASLPIPPTPARTTPLTHPYLTCFRRSAPMHRARRKYRYRAWLEDPAYGAVPTHRAASTYGALQKSALPVR